MMTSPADECTLRGCRKAHRQTAKQLVESSHDAATAGCMTEHRHRRILAARMLEAIPQAFAAEPLGLAKFRELAFAALAYARDEVAWYFLHVNEVSIFKFAPIPPIHLVY